MKWKKNAVFLVLALILLRLPIPFSVDEVLEGWRFRGVDGGNSGEPVTVAVRGTYMFRCLGADRFSGTISATGLGEEATQGFELRGALPTQWDMGSLLKRNVYCDGAFKRVYFTVLENQTWDSGQGLCVVAPADSPREARALFQEWLDTPGRWWGGFWSRVGSWIQGVAGNPAIVAATFFIALFGVGLYLAQWGQRNRKRAGIRFAVVYGALLAGGMLYYYWPTGLTGLENARQAPHSQVSVTARQGDWTFTDDKACDALWDLLPALRLRRVLNTPAVDDMLRAEDVTYISFMAYEEEGGGAYTGVVCNGWIYLPEDPSDRAAMKIWNSGDKGYYRILDDRPLREWLIRFQEGDS